MKWWIDKNDILRLLIQPEAKIIDIGCGPNPVFDNATNVDKSIQNVPNFILAEAEALPFEQFEFDYAVLSEILEHVVDPKKILEEAQRVAKFVVFTVPNEFQWDKRLKPFSHPEHLRYFTEESLFDLTIKVGLQEPEFIKICVMGWSHFIIFGFSKNSNIEKEIRDERPEWASRFIPWKEKDNAII